VSKFKCRVDAGHSAEFKAEAVSACMRPGISMAAVALHYRVSANLLR
jgi:transposase